MPVPTDFRLYHGNDLELLAGLLAAELARPAPGAALLAPDTVLIPQPAMRRWLQKHLAEVHGIAANLEFLAPGEFVARALDANLPDASAAPIADPRRLRWRLWRVLSDPVQMRAPVLRPLLPLLGGADPALAAWQLAGEVADAFEKYQAWRRHWLLGWDRGAGRDDWQAELWRLATHGLGHRARRVDAYLQRFGTGGDDVPRGLPGRVFAFATQNVSPDVLRVIASASRSGILHFYFLSPVRGWWGDLRSTRELLRDAPDTVFSDNENPLLRANGSAGRDFVRTLFSYEVVHPDFEEPVYVGPDPELRTGLLHRLQRDLLERRPPPDQDPATRAALPLFATAGRADASLQVHSCHTRLREVQVLHEQLRALLESDPTLQPRDIAVLTPDIDAYAPFVQAVFGADSAPRQSIPFAIGDGSALATHPVAQAFVQLLALPEARFGINDVLALLSVGAIAERFAIAPVELDTLSAWLQAAGARWGLDADHRAALGAPREDAFTWAWALDRLLLGHATGSDDDIDGIAPLPVLEGSALASFDRLLQALRALAHAQRILSAARAPAAWQAALSQLLEALFPDVPRDPGDGRALEFLRALVKQFADESLAAGVVEPVAASVVRDWFDAALGEDNGRQPFLTGGVTFGKMVPMRLVPFKVICLLGMSDGEFPRRDPPGGLNRLAAALGGPQRQLGDRSIRDDDRALFLQLFSAATQAFHVSYLGQDPRSGETLPPSVVVSELLDVAARYFGDPGFARRDLLVVHPLQPFSPAALGGDAGQGADARRFSYRRGWSDAAAAGGGERRGAPPFARPLDPPAMEAPLDWTRDQLVRALAHPPREFLAERLGLRTPERDELLPDEEPFDGNDGLGRWQLDTRVFDLALELPLHTPVGVDALASRLLAEGRIAPGAAGRDALRHSIKRLAPALDAWRNAGATRPRPWQLDLGPHRLSGVLPRVHDGGLRQFSASKGHGRSLIALGVDALAWSALGETAPISRFVLDGGIETIAAMPAAEARANLEALLQLAARARLEALPFMPKAGHLLWLAGDDEIARKQARKSWSGANGEGSDAAVRIALRGAMPFEHAAQTAQMEILAAEIFSSLPAGSNAAANALAAAANAAAAGANAGAGDD
ncbi:exodeoxyribonuclease V subunit gamma [soil metagenome]